jgi:hypothetical protein
MSGTYNGFITNILMAPNSFPVTPTPDLLHGGFFWLMQMKFTQRTKINKNFL